MEATMDSARVEQPPSDDLLGVSGLWPAAQPPFDDMRDDGADLARGQPLAHALKACQQIILPAYTRADHKARRTQGIHFWIIRLAVLFGTAAVLFAVLELCLMIIKPGPTLVDYEGIAAFVALFSVGLGIIAALQRDWLLARHQAEWCRRLKFRFLNDPVLYSGDATATAARIERLRGTVERIEKLTPKQLKALIAEDQLPGTPPVTSPVIVDPRAARALADYYRRTRLCAQHAYFSRRLRQNDRLDRITRYLPPAFFFGSVVFALAHFGGDELMRFGYDLPLVHGETTSVVLIGLAITLAVFGSGVRTFRGAHEFSRNTTRFRAKLVALDHLARALRDEPDPVAIHRHLWYSEQILESEHREWLRLMSDAEWFG
jgi:hypothetical protein